MKSDFSVALESGKVFPPSLFLSFLSNSREMPGEMHAGTGQQHFLCGSRVENEGFASRDSSLIINPQNLSFLFTLSLVCYLSLQEKYTCMLVGKSKLVFVCEIEALHSLCMASALFFPTKKVKMVLHFNCKTILDELMQIIKGKI